MWLEMRIFIIPKYNYDNYDLYVSSGFLVVSYMFLYCDEDAVKLNLYDFFLWIFFLKISISM